MGTLSDRLICWSLSNRLKHLLSQPLFWSSILLFACFLALGIAQTTGWLSSLDRAFYALLYQQQQTVIAYVITILGEIWFVAISTVVAILWLWRKKKTSSSLWLLLSVIGGASLTLGFKELFQQVRPFVDQTLTNEYGFSFPSGHAMAALYFYGMLAWLCAKNLNSSSKIIVWIAYSIIALAIGWSRIALGVHWPIDVLGGWLLGSSWLLFLLALHKS
ncbi:MAG: phosphatase PAP2 family protein [bacterium]